MDIQKIVKKIGLLHSTSIETPTSFDLARIMVNQLEVNWSDPALKILDPSCGRGTILLAVAERLEQAGHDRKHIVENMLYGCDKSHVQAMIARRALSLFYNGSINIEVDDSITKGWDMKFDVIIGNPPYQAPKKGDYSFWARFVDLSHKLLKDDGFMSMIIPAGWMSPTNDIRQGKRSVMRDIFAKENTYYINIDPDLGKKFFPGVGQKFTWFCLQKGDYLETEVDFGNSQITVDLTKLPMLAKETDETNIGIITKISSKGDKWNFTRYIMPETWDDLSFEKKGKFQYPRINGNSNHLDKIAYSKNPCKFQTLKKVVLPYNGSEYKFVVDEGVEGCTNAYTILLNENDLVESAKTYFNSALIKWLSKNKFTQYNEGALINSLSKIDLSKEITENDIYKFYGLTNDEVEYLKSNA